MKGSGNNSIEQSNEQVSPDEKMLKELENRDGIYSFIFHELESSRSDTITTNILEPIASATTNTVTTTNVCFSTSKSVNSLPLISSMLSSTAMPTTMTVDEILPPLTTATKATSATRTNRLNEFRLFTSDDDVKPAPSFEYAFLDHTYPRRSDDTTATCSSLTSYQSIFSDNRNFYGYMPNTSLSLRHTPPRFSHISAPMMRNRRHLLKNTAKYKEMYNGSNSVVPDLRTLFPHDPDVYAPFDNDTTP